MVQDTGRGAGLWLFTSSLALSGMLSVAQKPLLLILLNFKNGKFRILQHSSSSSPWSICASHTSFLKHQQQRMPGKHSKIDSTIVTLPLCTPVSSPSLPRYPWLIALPCSITLMDMRITSGSWFNGAKIHHLTIHTNTWLTTLVMRRSSHIIFSWHLLTLGLMLLPIYSSKLTSNTSTAELGG